MSVYFAYGSNLDWRDWSKFCARHNADPRCMKPIGPALLPDVELVFNYRSVLREGGALNIRPRKGQVVYGVLFDSETVGERPIFHRFFLKYSRYARQNRQNLCSLCHRFAIEHLSPTGC